MEEEHTQDTILFSTEFYSQRIESMREAMSPLDMNNEKAKVEAEIKSSRVHWSQLASDYRTTVEGVTMESCTSESERTSEMEGRAEWILKVAEDNVEVFRSQQELFPGGFFYDEDDKGLECSVGAVLTRFWKAPEILHVLKSRNIY